MRKVRNSIADGNETDGINLTPLIDVVFVVLIMFIVVAPMLELDRIQLAQGAAPETKELVSFSQESAISVRIKDDDSIWLDKRPIFLSQLPELLRRAKERAPGQVPQLYADRNAHFGTYQSVKNCLEEAGFEEMEVVLKPK